MKRPELNLKYINWLKSILYPQFCDSAGIKTTNKYVQGVPINSGRLDFKLSANLKKSIKREIVWDIIFFSILDSGCPTKEKRDDWTRSSIFSNNHSQNSRIPKCGLPFIITGLIRIFDQISTLIIHQNNISENYEITKKGRPQFWHAIIGIFLIIFSRVLLLKLD